MQSLWRHIDNIIARYDGQLPLTHFLKSYFKQNPILGSRDRKILAEMAYCYYRCAHGFDDNISLVDKVTYALLFANSAATISKNILTPKLLELLGKNFSEIQAEAALEGVYFDLEKLLSLDVTLSKGISKEEWLGSILSRPQLFIRVGNNYLSETKKLLQQAQLVYEQIDTHCIALENGIAIEKILPSHFYRVQDLSSQRTSEYMPTKQTINCWDCCCGAGGKSLLLAEQSPWAKLCVSDIRPSILKNLHARFKQYKLPKPETLVLSAADSAACKQKLGNRKFQFIIADVPCTGSGTWARTPEQLYYFNQEKLRNYAQKQHQIVSNASEYLAEDGILLYITCSVFAEENEGVLYEILKERIDLNLITRRLINGVGDRADSMFVAILKKENGTASC